MRKGTLIALLGAAATVGAALLAYGWIVGFGPAAPSADPANADQVALGRTIYRAQCASCHGASLEGQPEWRQRKPDGRLPAPPHDATGHTWHHSDAQLFRVTKDGLVPPIAPPDYPTDMPAFAGKLSDAEIWAVLAYIKSTWPDDIRERQRQIDSAAGR